MGLSTLDVELTIVEGRNIRTRHHVTPKVKKLRFRVVARIGNQEHQTKTVAVPKKSYPTWNSKHDYNVSKGNSLTLELFCEHKHRKSHSIGCSEGIDVLSLVRFQDHDIKIRNDKGMESGIIPVRFDVLISSRMDLNSQSQSPIHLQHIPPKWANLLVSLNSFSQLARTVAQLDPMARLVVATMTFAIEIAAQQIERDKKVEGLIETMAAIYRLILDAKPLENIKAFQETLARLLEKTTECALFIADYCQPQNFMVKAIHGATSCIDMLIDSFEKSFIALRMEFVTNVCLHEMLHTIRILEKVEDIEKDVHDINAVINLPVYGEAWDVENMYLPDSLKGVLDDVTQWVIRRQPEAPVYLLMGPPGCGKTCVANSTAAMFAHGKRLGASIFLDRRNKEHQDASKLFASIARELGTFDDKLKICISRAISQQPRLLQADIERQLQGLIIEPLRKVTVVGPILVVIDGLDGCKDRHRVLSALENAMGIPENLRILITARPDADIVAHLTRIPHCYTRQMKGGKEGIVGDVSKYARQCLNVLQDIRPGIFADVSLEEALPELEAKSYDLYLWFSVAIRFLTIASDDTARAFLTEIFSTSIPSNRTRAMLDLKYAICQALSATSPVRLKSDLSIGGAAALGVIGLRSEKTAIALETMVAQGLMKYDDVAGQYLSSIPHPASKSARGTTDDHTCSHAKIEDGHGINTCMAHVCIDFLDIRLAADVCIRNCQILRNGEPIIDPSLVELVPEHFRPYINEAYRYALRFWMAHLKDVQYCCAIVPLRSKLLCFSRHLRHLSERENGQKRDLGDIIQGLLTVIGSSELNNANLHFQFHKLLTGIRSSCHGHGKRSPEHWEATVDAELCKTVCTCPLYPAWRISSPSVCSLKADVEYEGMAPANSSLCVMVTPPVMPLAGEGGRIRRTIKEVGLVVDRTAYDDAYQRLPPDTQIGVAVIRDSIPRWTRQLPSPLNAWDGVAYQMECPWLSPTEGEISSVTVCWVDNRFRFQMDQCPLQPGDCLGLTVRWNSPWEGVLLRIPVTLNVEYAAPNNGDGK